MQPLSDSRHVIDVLKFMVLLHAPDSNGERSEQQASVLGREPDSWSVKRHRRG